MVEIGIFTALALFFKATSLICEAQCEATVFNYLLLHIRNILFGFSHWDG